MAKEIPLKPALRPGAVALLLLSVVACAGCGAPTAPSTTARIIRLSGDLAFGNVKVGTQASATLTITNSGTSPLTVSGMTDSSVFTASWTKGTIPAGGSQQVTIRFAPPAAETYGLTLMVNGDQTSGTNTIAMSGTGYDVTTQTYNWVLDPGKLESCTATSCQAFSGSATNAGSGCASDVWFHIEFYTQESGNSLPDSLVSPVDTMPAEFVLHPGQPLAFQTGAISNPSGRHITGWQTTIHYMLVLCQ